MVFVGLILLGRKISQLQTEVAVLKAMDGRFLFPEDLEDGDYRLHSDPPWRIFEQGWDKFLIVKDVEQQLPPLFSKRGGEITAI